MNNSIIFTDEEGAETAFYVLEQTVLAGVTYLLVTDSEDEEDGSFLILKENKTADSEEAAAFDIVSDDNELKSIIGIFSELLDDIDLEV